MQQCMTKIIYLYNMEENMRFLLHAKEKNM